MEDLITCLTHDSLRTLYSLSINHGTDPAASDKLLQAFTYNCGSTNLVTELDLALDLCHSVAGETP